MSPAATGRSARGELLGIALVLGAAACFSALDTTTKHVGASVPLLMALWFRYAFQAVATATVVIPLRGARVLRTRHLPFQILRGLLLLTSSLLAFTSLRYMPVGEFTAIVMMAPLAVTLLAATVLKEHVSPFRCSLVAGGFLGTLVIMRPGGESFSWAMLLPLGLVASNAWFQVLTSRMARTEDPLTTHLYTGWVGTLVASVTLPSAWASIPDPWLWASLALMGAMGTIGHFLLILAYRNAPAATLTPYLYAQIGFSMLGGWLVFAHLPSSSSFAGMALIALCGAAGAWARVREARLPLQAARA